jgi:catechol 2,3-dioxygenase-like lactoylglutathione lyase family enzyme
MGRITHMAMCTKNNRRLARFYRIVFGWEEVWNPVQNNPYAYYIGDGYFNLNCLQIRQGGAREKQPSKVGHSRGAGVVVEGKLVLPEVGINHIGFQVDDLAETNRTLASLKPAITPVASPLDGRYEDQRFLDPEVNDVELSQRVWDPGPEKKSALARHVAFSAADPDRLAEFYRFALGMKTIGRVEAKDSGMTAVYLSDGTMNMALVKNPPIAKRGVQLLGIKVENIKEIGERLQDSAEFLYPGEAPIELRERPASSPYKAVYFKDPDGNEIDLSEEGWDV